jgi:4-aminobutyrate aminotransferase-like enzyme
VPKGVSYPLVFRRPDGESEAAYNRMMIEQFERFLVTGAAPETIAAVVMEPVQQEGGFIVPASNLYKESGKYAASTDFILEGQTWKKM